MNLWPPRCTFSSSEGMLLIITVNPGEPTGVWPKLAPSNAQNLTNNELEHKKLPFQNSLYHHPFTGWTVWSSKKTKDFRSVSG